jgi:hypothetical protein
MTAIETLDDVYATLVEKADDTNLTQRDRTMLMHAAQDVWFRRSALELIAEAEHRREMIGFGPVGAVLVKAI